MNTSPAIPKILAAVVVLLTLGAIGYILATSNSKLSLPTIGGGGAANNRGESSRRSAPADSIKLSGVNDLYVPKGYELTFGDLKGGLAEYTTKSKDYTYDALRAWAVAAYSEAQKMGERDQRFAKDYSNGYVVCWDKSKNIDGFAVHDTVAVLVTKSLTLEVQQYQTDIAGGCSTRLERTWTD